MQSLGKKLAALGLMSGLGYVGAARATPIPVGNADFELVSPDQWDNNPPNLVGQYTYSQVDWAPWVTPDYLYSSVYNPANRPDPRSGVAAAHSSNSGATEGLYQNLTTNFQSGKTYRFRIYMQEDSSAGDQHVQMAFYNATDNPASSDNQGTFNYPGVFLATTSDLSAANGDFKIDGGYAWQRTELQYTATPDDDGKQIGIGIFTVSGPNNKVVFDDASVDVGPFPPDVPGPTSWRQDVSGDWNLFGNWTNDIPNGIDRVANFTGAITQKRTVFTDTDVTVGTINFDSPNSYLITGQGSLTMQTSSGHALINVVQGRHKINLPLTFANDTDLNVAGGAALVIADPVFFASGITVNKNGAGELDFISTQNAGTGALLKINGGIVNIDQNGGSNLHIVAGAALNFNAPQQLASLALTTGGVATLKSGNAAIKVASLGFEGSTNNWHGKLDLTDNDLIVQSADAASAQAALANITNQIGSARNSSPAKWQGQGITSSVAAADTKKITGLAVALNDNGAGGVLYSSFDGLPVDKNSVLVKYTYNGDMDLNGKIDADDYFRIDNGFVRGLTGYSNGDLDFNGKVDADDYFLIDSAFLSQGAALTGESFAAASAAVPEPGTFGLLAIAGISIMMSQRRMRRR